MCRRRFSTDTSPPPRVWLSRPPLGLTKDRSDSVSRPWRALPRRRPPGPGVHPHPPAPAPRASSLSALPPATRDGYLTSSSAPPPPPTATSPRSRSTQDPRRQLNPEAIPFPPPPDVGPSEPEAAASEGICFSIPSDSEGDDDKDEELHWLPPCDSPKGKGIGWIHGDARRTGRAPRSSSPPLVAGGHSVGTPPPLWLMRTASAGSSATDTIVLKLAANSPSGYAGRSPLIWWGVASTAWRQIMWHRNAPTHLAVSVASRLGTSLKTARGLASRVRRCVVAVV
ncbi:hypothetical protein PVAP13_3NG140893 [Panicum virgatum]|uniref:Uncharacterized protein n=1 Tax=Panicum virgatum TaxID=38727 RepID=A0A8T0U559_PANVG|nr:hypothetical protein PVAP13_3NG140893 [Panicum virgatum]